MDYLEGMGRLLEVCHFLYERGLVSGSGGNVSVKVGDAVLITPTGRNLGTLEEKDIVLIDPNGRCSGGKPSKEWRMHLRCYVRSEITCVVHTHSLYAVAVSCMPGDYALPAYTPGYALRVGKLPVIPYFHPGSPELAEEVGTVIASRNSVLLANHGLVTVEQSAEAALNLAEEIEENAHLFFILGNRGRPLDKERQDELAGKR